MTAYLDAALAYAAAGWPVFPCNPCIDPPGTKRRKSKSPLVPGADRDPATDKPIPKTGGLWRATTDEAQIRAWWKRWPKALIGVPTGRACGAFVVDFDPDEKNGTLAEIERRLIAQVGPLRLQLGPHSETQSGGRHLWYALPEGVDMPPPRSGLRGADGEKIAGVDVRGEGGYVIVPPSVMANGRAYSWISPPSALGQGVPLPKPPAALLDFVLQRGRFDVKAARQGARPAPGPVPAQTRAPAPSQTSGGGRSDFFVKVNALALESIDAWAPRLLPSGHQEPGTGAWRISSRDLGRDLEEDLSIHPNGIRDFGTEQTMTAVDVVMEHGGAADAVQAAFWLCEALGATPESLGWRTAQRRRAPGPAPCQAARLDGGSKGSSQRQTAKESPRASDAKAQKGGKAPQRDGLIAFGMAADLFQWQGEAFATAAVNGHRETYRMRSRAFRNWLNLRHYEATGGAAGGQAIEDALGALEAEALSRGPERQAHLRIAEHGGAIYLDLCDARWRVVEVRPGGWRVIEAAEAPVRFIRQRGMLELPEPMTGGRIGDLAPYVNVNPADMPLVTAWLTATFRAKGPFPILTVSGEQGSAKSTLLRVLRSLVDPSVAPIRTMPREERDLIVAARNSWLLALDNLSAVPPWLSDGLARIATGGGFSARQLHTDLDEVIVEVCRPIAINGIPDLTGRPDLADRAVAVHLPAIEGGARRTEAGLWEAFTEDRPYLLGAVLDAVASGLARLEDVDLPEAPRMADFARWGCAVEEAIGLDEGEFMELYRANIAGLVQAVVDDDLVATAARDIADAVAGGELESPEPAAAGSWLGTASDLLEVFRSRLGERLTQSKFFPQAPNALSTRLRRAAPALRAIGVHVEAGRVGKARARLIQIERRTMDGGRSIAPMS